MAISQWEFGWHSDYKQTNTCTPRQNYLPHECLDMSAEWRSEDITLEQKGVTRFPLRRIGEKLFPKNRDTPTKQLQ